MCALEAEKPAKILVVDDIPQNLVAIEAALTGLNCELVMATSGPQALRFLLEQDFALILLDVQMPSMDGFETATMIRGRSRTRHVPIIFVTAYGRNDNDVNAAYRLGAVDFLFKPVSAEVVRAKASVFVELQRRTAEVAKQAALLKQNEEMIRERALTAQRRRLEAEALRQRLAEQKVHTGLLATKNNELELIQAELEKSNARLEGADRKKDEFIAILAHELRNPLAAMVSGIELLDWNAADEVARLRAVMQRQCSHLSRLVDDLLDVSRVSSGKMKLQKQNVKIGIILSDALEFSRSSIEHGQHSLDVHCDVQDAIVYGDPVRLSQIIVNLLSNAVRYTDPGGQITLSAARQDDDSGICIAVSDNGRGMTSELINDVFNLFIQGESGGDGLGIGLTMVRDLAKLHGGQVSAHSDGLGKGSEFRVVLPEASSDASTSPKVEKALANANVKTAPSDATTPLLIVVIDDHEDLRALTKALLERWGHEVFEAPTGLAGVDLVIEKRPDLAIIDIGLPDIEGYEVAEKIREAIGSDCPRLIAMSGYAQPGDRKKSKEAGFDLHLSKPVKPASLKEVLHTAGATLNSQPARKSEL